MLAELQATLYAEIPITQNIQIQVMTFDEDVLTLRAPLAANINHKGTVFAGSLNAVATLAGWGLMWLLLKRENIAAAHIVIQDSQIRYLHPVQQDFQATCRLPDSAALQRFFTMLQRRGVARLELATTIMAQESVAVEFSGRYVVTLHGE